MGERVCRPSWRRVLTAVVASFSASFAASFLGPFAHLPAGAAAGAATPAKACPWARPGALGRSTPAALAAEVVARMTLAEKLGMVDLKAAGGYENESTGVPSLCIPRSPSRTARTASPTGSRG